MDENTVSESEYITIKINANIYKGFQHKMKREIYNALSLIEVIYVMKIKMKSFFHENNLYSLENGVDELELHFHDDIPYNRPIIYLCDDDHGIKEQP